MADTMDMIKPYTGSVVSGGDAPSDDPMAGITPYTGSVMSDQDSTAQTGPGENPANVESSSTYPELPEPNLDMYDDLKGKPNGRELALQRYEMYRNHPDATSGSVGLGRDLIYRGKVVPPPATDVFGEPDTSWMENVKAVPRNAAKNVLETLGAGGDWIVAKTGVSTPQLFDPDSGEFNPRMVSAEERTKRGGLASRTAKNMAEVDAGSGFWNNFTIEGGQLVVGGGGGLKVASTVVKKAPQISKGLNRGFELVGKFLGFEVGAASAVSDKVQTLLIGDNAMFKSPQEALPFMKGVNVDPNSPEYEQILARRLNILTDAALLAKPAEGVVKGGVWVANFINTSLFAPLLNIGSRSKMEENVVREILDTLAAVGSKGDEASVEAKKKIVELIDANKNVFIRSEDEIMGELNMTLDTMSALEKALKDNQMDRANEIIAQARSMRSGALNAKGGAPDLTTTMGAPAREFEASTVRVEQGAGGTDAIQQTTDALAQSGRNEVQAARDVVTDTQARLAKAEQDVDSLIRNDPTFGARLDQLSQASGIDIGRLKNEASDSIVAKVRMAYEAMDARKNELYSAIQGGRVEPQQLLDVLTNLRPGQLDAARGALPANSQFGVLLDTARRRRVGVVDDAGTPVMITNRNGEQVAQMRDETDAEMLSRVSRWMQSNNLDFGRLYTEIRPSVSSTADTLFNASTPEAQGAAQTLRQFVQWIDGPALDTVIASGDTAVADAARGAKEYYVREFAPFWRDGVLKDVADIHRQTVGRTSDDMAAQGLEVRPIDFQNQVRTSIEGALSDGRRELGTQVITLLRRPEAGGNPRLVTDFILGDVVGGLKNDLMAGAKLDEVALSGVVSRLSNYSATISRNFPEEAARISTFIDNLRGAKGNVQALRNELDLATQASKQAEDTILNGELSKFFANEGMGTVPNGYKAMADIFANEQNLDNITSLVQRANATGNPLVVRGMQAAYARYLRNRLLNATEELGGNKAVSVAQIRKIDEETTDILRYGDTIFADRPGIMDATRQLLEISGALANSGRAKPIASDAATASRSAAIQATDKLITLSLGVLSRTGARVRAATGNVINTLAPDKVALRILDTVYSDPDEFIKIANRVIKADTKMDEALRDSIFAFMVRGGIYNEEDREDFLPAMMEAELDYRKFKKSVGEQMDSVLGISP